MTAQINIPTLSIGLTGVTISIRKSPDA